MRSGRRFINRRSKSAHRAVTRIIGIDWQMPMAHGFPDESWPHRQFRAQPGGFYITLFRHLFWPIERCRSADTLPPGGGTAFPFPVDFPNLSTRHPTLVTWALLRPPPECYDLLLRPQRQESLGFTDIVTTLRPVRGNAL
jgi:hypothetical protein